MADRERSFSLYVHGVFGLCYDRPDWETMAKQ